MFSVYHFKFSVLLLSRFSSWFTIFKYSLLSLLAFTLYVYSFLSFSLFHVTLILLHFSCFRFFGFPFLDYLVALKFLLVWTALLNTQSALFLLGWSHDRANGGICRLLMPFQQYEAGDHWSDQCWDLQRHRRKWL